jgi:hypothetical protein
MEGRQVKKLLVSVLPLCFLCLSMEPVLSRPGHDHGPQVRTWKDNEGLFEIQGSFVQLRDDKVQLSKSDGTTVWVPFGRLGLADRDWVLKKVDAIRSINESQNVEFGSQDGATQDNAAGFNIGLAVLFLLGLVMIGFVCKFLQQTGAAGGRWGQLATIRKMALPASAVALATGSVCLLAETNSEKEETPQIQKAFEPFADRVKFRSDKNYFYIESNGMPDHPMMIGIRAWQQQVPLPQPYTGSNAWRIPLHPKMAANPVSAKSALFRGAIALAVNGVPIFNPIKNDGRTDTLIAGELDEFGGHCGRGDDYHYHIGPVHLEKIVGKGNPIAYALDGYPLYGYTDANGKEPRDLDKFNGRMEEGGYRYYSTRKYPYINGGMRGEVTVIEDQVDPQPRANNVRPALPPLRGARITGFKRDEAQKTATVIYQIEDKTHSVNYVIENNGTYHFVFTDGDGRETVEDYQSRKGGGQGKKDRPDGMKEGKNNKKDSSKNKKGSDNKKDGQEKGKKRPDEKKDGDGLRLPWLGAHFDELDTNKDGILTLDELKKEFEKTFSGYDKDKNGVLHPDEYSGRSSVRSALAGFVKGHSGEFADKDGKITRQALQDALFNMFKKSDPRGTGKLTKAEVSSVGPRNKN